MNEQPCGCALQCFDKLSTEQRKKSYTGFWALGNFDVQMRTCVDVSRFPQ